MLVSEIVAELADESELWCFEEMCKRIAQPGKLACSARLRTKRGFKTLVIQKDDNANLSFSLQEVR